MTTLHKWMWGAAAVVLIFAGYSWLKEHDARLTLSTQQIANKAALADIADSEKVRVAALAAQLGALTKLQRATVTPAQVVAQLPTVLPLPAPVTQVTEAQAATTPGLSEGDLIIPKLDAKPLFDAQIACKKCSETLTSSNAQIANLESTIAVKDKEIKQRDEVINGGTKWKRTKTALIWLGAGTVISGGAVAVLHHR